MKKFLNKINTASLIDPQNIEGSVKAVLEKTTDEEDKELLIKELDTVLKDHVVLTLDEDQLKSLSIEEKKNLLNYLKSRNTGNVTIVNYNLKYFRSYIDLLDFKNKFEGKYIKVTQLSKVCYYYVRYVGHADYVIEDIDGLIGKVTMECDFIEANDLANVGEELSCDFIHPIVGYSDCYVLEDIGRFNQTIEIITKEEFNEMLEKSRQAVNKYINLLKN